jgi:hypothetical protein
MAAIMNDFNDMLTRIGFTASARDVLTDPDKENIQIGTLRQFTDEGVQTLCKSLRNPGGTVAAVAPVAPAVVPPPIIPIVGGRRGRAIRRVQVQPVAAGVLAAPVVQNIRNPGVYVSALAELNLTITCYIARHYHRTNRTLTADIITLDRIERYQLYKKAEKDYKEPDELLKLTKVDKVQDFIDDFPEHLEKYVGQDGRPLSYVIRSDAVIPDEDTDPTYGEPGCAYASFRDEIAARSSIVGNHYAVDNARVLQLLNDAIATHSHVKAWVKDYQRSHDGRNAWFTFRAHYRGQSELETIQVKAEQRLDQLQYRGEKPRYNFELHVSNHRKSHNEILKSSGIPLQEQVKVRKLTASILAPELKTAKSTIAAIDTLRQNFDECVNYLKGQIHRNDSGQTEDRQVSSAASKQNENKRKATDDNGNSNNKKKGKKGKNKLDRWYSPAEYRALPEKDKIALRNARKARKAAAASTDNGNGNAAGDTTPTSGGTSQRQSSNTNLQKDF